MIKALLAPGTALGPPPLISWHTAAWADDPLWTAPADGGAVSSWRDLSGNGLHFVQATGANQPTFRASVAGLNGHAGIQGDGVNDRLTVAGLNLTGARSLVAVGSMTGGTFPALVAGGTATNGSDLIALYRSTSGFHKFYAGTADVGPSSGDANVHTFRALWDGTGPRLVVDGTATTGNPGTRILTSLHVLGSPYTVSNVHNAGYIGFVGLYVGDVTAHTNWSAFCAWVLAYYGKALA